MRVLEFFGPGHFMNATNSVSMSWLDAAIRWLKDQIIGEVPAESAVCEFDCRKQQCSYAEWLVCSRRLSYFAESRFAPRNRV
jgi:hypothetical protein